MIKETMSVSYFKFLVQRLFINLILYEPRFRKKQESVVTKNSCPNSK